MASFPNSPSVGATAVMNGMTYTFNSQGAWEISLTQSDETLVDVGVATFSKSSTVLLYNFDNDSGTTIVDSSGHGNDGTATSLGTYVSSGAGSTTGAPASGLGFGDAADFTGSSYIDFPDLDLDTGDFTIEWWASQDTANQNKTSWSIGALRFNTWMQSAYNNDDAYLVDGTNNMYWNDVTSTTGAGNWYLQNSGNPNGNAWRHFAVTRKTTGSNAQHHLFFDGKRCTPATGDGTPIGNWTTLDLTGTTGRIGSDSLGTSSFMFAGNIDEFTVHKSVIYDSATYEVPLKPFPPIPPTAIAGKALLYAKDVSGTTKLHVMDSSGSGDLVT